MHFFAKQSVLLENLSILEKAIPVRSPLQIIKGIFVEAKNNCLTFMTNNLEMGIRADCDNVEIKEEGAVVLPEKFVDIIRQLPSEDIEIKTDGEELRTEILSKQTNFFLYGMNADEFPVITGELLGSQWESLEFSAMELKQIIKKVSFAVSQDESKHLFRGILLEIDMQKNIFCMASDTYRLAYYQKTLKKKMNIQPLRILVPGKTLIEISRIIDDSHEKVACFFRENEIIFKYRNFTFKGRLLEDKFPNFSNAFPAGFNTKILVNTRLLEKTIGRASLLVHSQNLMITLSINDKMLQVRSGSEIGRMTEDLILEGKDGDDLEEILLNYRFFLDPLRVLEEDFVEIEFNGPFGPCIFNYRQELDDSLKSYRYLVLPIKIEKKDL